MNETQTKATSSESKFAKDAETWYNNNKDADGSVRINTKNLKPLNDPKCQHNWYLDESDADSSWADVYKCSLCPLGILAKKSDG